MPEREIREKYGGKLDKAINRAVRAETEGGIAALDKLARLSGPAASSGWTDADGNFTPAAAAYVHHRDHVVAPLIAQVRRTWGLPALKPAAPKTARDKASRPRRTGRSGRRSHND